MSIEYIRSKTVVNTDMLHLQLEMAISYYEHFTLSEGELKLYFSQALTTQEETELDTFLSSFNDIKLYPKIYDYVSPEIADHLHTDIDYTITCDPNLHPKRYFTKGELNKVEWYGDSGLTDLVLEVAISYTRDVFGFASERSTVRKWMLNNETWCTCDKTTTKKYNINPIDQIKEGKKRRGNIVDGIQLPTMQFMMEVLIPQGVSQGEILLMGRAFIDRHEREFNKFIDSSSSIIDPNDPNFGKKSIVVAIETDADSGDYDWLKGTPTSLGGSITIEQFLASEFSI